MGVGTSELDVKLLIFAIQWTMAFEGLLAKRFSASNVMKLGLGKCIYFYMLLVHLV